MRYAALAGRHSPGRRLDGSVQLRALSNQHRDDGERQLTDEPRAELVDGGDLAAEGWLSPTRRSRAHAGSVSGHSGIERMLSQHVVLYENGTPPTKHVTTASAA